MTRILVVEDEHLIRVVIERALLRLGGYEVVATEEVAEVQRLAAAGAVDLVLMDVSLSRTQHDGQLIDGLAFTRLLKAHPATRHVPVVLVTAHALPGDGERLMQVSGADAYLAKPFPHARVLVDKVRQVLAAR